jgi:hypothetical protein
MCAGLTIQYHLGLSYNVERGNAGPQWRLLYRCGRLP